MRRNGNADMKTALSIIMAVAVCVVQATNAEEKTMTLAESVKESPANIVNPSITGGVVRVTYVSPRDNLEDWALVLPPATGRTWAVVLHGHGSHGDQLYTREDIRQHWLNPLRAAGLGLLTPNLRDNAWMSPAAVGDLHDLLGWVRTRYGAQRFVFLSGSMGGAGNLIYATLHPEDCAAVVALGATTDLAAYHAWLAGHTNGIQPQIAVAVAQAYGGTPAQLPDLYRRHSSFFQRERLTMPIFTAHGEYDVLMPVDQLRQLAAQLKGRPNFTYEEVPKGNHDSPLFLKSAMTWFIKQAESK